jgi:hypothetical protein
VLLSDRLNTQEHNLKSYAKRIQSAPGSGIQRDHRPHLANHDVGESKQDAPSLFPHFIAVVVLADSNLVRCSQFYEPLRRGSGLVTGWLRCAVPGDHL